MVRINKDIFNLLPKKETPVNFQPEINLGDLAKLEELGRISFDLNHYSDEKKVEVVEPVVKKKQPASSPQPIQQRGWSEVEKQNLIIKETEADTVVTVKRDFWGREVVKTIDTRKRITDRQQPFQPMAYVDPAVGPDGQPTGIVETKGKSFWQRILSNGKSHKF